VAFSASRLAARRAAHAALMLVATVALVVAWSLVIRTLLKPAPAVRPVASPHALAWGDKVFLNQAQLRAWLRNRGIPYESWARHHTAAIRVLNPKAAPPAAARSAKLRRPRPKTHPPRPTRARATERRAAAEHAAAPTAGGAGGTNAVLLLAYGLMTALLLLALAPAKYLRPIHGRLDSYRSYAATAAIGLAAALLAAQFLP
jgi:hypothetical protein